MGLADGANQVLRRAFLRDIAGGAGLERLNRVLLLAVATQHDHAHAGEPLSHGAQDLQKTPPGHGDVEEHHVGRTRGERGEDLVARSRFSRDADIRAVIEEPADAITDQAVVVGDEDANHAAAGPIGKRSVTRVPAPVRLEISTDPPHASARSRIPSSPNESRGAGPGPKPRPLSRTASRSCPWAASRVTSTWVAPAWRVTLVSASCRMRKAAVARSSSTARSAGTSACAAMPVRRVNSPTCQRPAAASPRSSSPPGRNSAETRRPAMTVASTSVDTPPGRAIVPVPAGAPPPAAPSSVC